ncbi:MAG: EscU/YscU/HrcU family type III secretion system export apparatus switch protein [Deltaproteobacteria bacterium]
MNTDSAKKRQKAVALRYDRSRGGAPQVTATGKGHLAEKIIELARASGVPVREDAALAEVLSHLKLGDEIPPETYVLVAQILAWVYRMNGRAAKKDPR